jgi:1,4-alpha-glucan branching enzyme
MTHAATPRRSAPVRLAPVEAPPATPPAVRHDVTLWSDADLYLFNEGSHLRLWERLGAHALAVDGEPGTYFAVWAPSATRVSVVGDFNGWHRDSHLLAPRGSSGVWEGWIPGVRPGALYKYHIHGPHAGYRADKADPLAFYCETPPRTASIVWDLDYAWGDAAWMAERARRNALDAPIAIYEMHVGSWMRVPEEGNRSLSYRELAPRLADHLERLGFTHVEFLPIMEHPFFGSWGYQTTGYFVPSSRYGTPQDFMYLVDFLHQRGIGVILDWVPSHFPTDEYGLGYFDGTHLYEHADPREGFHPDWNSYIFNYGRHEVRAFLISSALFWLEQYHVDGLRIDAVASMLYRNYSRQDGEWIPNIYGGNENLEATSFLRRLNSEIYQRHPDVQTYAEESTAWTMVSRPTYMGGLGFGLKWDMGWMHDTLDYFQRDPIYRSHHHSELTFRQLYAYFENFVLPLSHDEVVYGKGSLLRKMPGDDWQKFANLRLLYGYMYGQSGKKLLFMGAEFGQWSEWNHDGSLEWHLTRYERHQQVERWMGDLNRLYREEPALHTRDNDPAGFEWCDVNDSAQSTLSFLRIGSDPSQVLLAVFNFTPMPRYNHRVGVPAGGIWRELLNSDAAEYGGGGLGNFGRVEAAPVHWHGRPQMLTITLPPLAVVYFKPIGD